MPIIGNVGGLGPSESMEAIMLLCFSMGWYWSIFCMLRTGVAHGKCAAFVLFTVIGYSFGLGAKLYDWAMGAPLSDVALIYFWNLAITMFDLALVVVLSRRPVLSDNR